VNIRPASDDEDPVINMVPMVDVVFQLLIFFMVATTLIEPERVLELELPKASSPTESPDPSNEIVLNVLEDGRIVYLGRNVAREELLELLRAAAARDRDTPVTIRGARRALHETVVGVLDACGIAGLSNLSVGTAPEERG
jgi:biopolymer transport protein ExbD